LPRIAARPAHIVNARHRAVEGGKRRLPRRVQGGVWL